MKAEVTFRVNRSSVTVTVEPNKTLADVLREDLGLVGTKLGCEHGVCGACTVLFNGAAARACLLLAVQAQGTEVETVEGLSESSELNDLQQAFQDHHALQCGFCTAGMLMSATALLREESDFSESAIREALSGNLCRCTGYQGVVRAVRELMAGRGGSR
jgi:aerobic carbon-monoxide dehydrogenase small subunit